MKKYFLSAIFLCAVLSVLSGCTKGTSTSDFPHKETEASNEPPTEPPTMYAIHPLFENEEISCILIYDATEETRIEITAEHKIKEIIAMFNNWDMDANKVPPLDLETYITIVFNDNLAMEISSSGPEVNYYGKVRNTPYCLPQAFWEYVYDKVN